MIWQPIETAPTDGTAIVVCNKESGGSWVAHHKAQFQSGYRPENPWQNLMLNCWHLPQGHPIGKPTHWMPLPPPPEAV